MMTLTETGQDAIRNICITKSKASRNGRDFPTHVGASTFFSLPSLFPSLAPNPPSSLPRPSHPRIESHARSLVFSFTRNVSPLLRPLSVRPPVSRSTRVFDCRGWVQQRRRRLRRMARGMQSISGRIVTWNGNKDSRRLRFL